MSKDTSDQAENLGTEQNVAVNARMRSNYDFMYKVQPVHLIFAASVPLCLGAFVGYKLEMKRSDKKMGRLPPSTKSGSNLLKRVMGGEMASRVGSGSHSAVSGAGVTAGTVTAQQLEVNVGRLAFKALGLGSILSIGGVGLLTTAIFRTCGCDDLEDMISTLRDWTPKKRRALEDYLGIKPKSMQHEDVIITTNMTEEEEWNFIKKKYIPELADDDGFSQNKTEGSEATSGEL